MKLKYFEELTYRVPVLLAAWPGMGQVALGAVDYIRRKLNAKPFAEIDLSDEYLPNEVVVEEGLIKLPRPPANVFYYKHNPDILIFESTVQFSGELGANVMFKIVELSMRFGVKNIFTGAAFPKYGMTSDDPSEIYAVANSKKMRDYIYRKLRVKIMEEGRITGMNGLLLAYAMREGIDAACFLASMPAYAIQFPNPKASRAIVEVLCELLGFSVDLEEINYHISIMAKEFAKIEEAFQLSESQEEPTEKKPKEVPQSVLKRIEKLFEESRHDKSKAYILKRELDRWNLFEKYEDRFLDLFKKEKH